MLQLHRQRCQAAMPAAPARGGRGDGRGAVHAAEPPRCVTLGAAQLFVFALALAAVGLGSGDGLVPVVSYVEGGTRACITLGPLRVYPDALAARSAYVQVV